MYRYSVRAPQHVPRVTLQSFVRHAFPLLPESAVRQAFERRDVKMDGMRAGKDQRVVPGAEVDIYTPCPVEIPVVYEDERVLALDKPAGVSCDADEYGSMTVGDWASLYAEGKWQPRLCHRLDNQTSGLLILAKDENTELALLAMFSRRECEKTYHCIVRGQPDPREGVREAWLTKDARRGLVRVIDRETAGAKRIRTAYRTLEGGGVSLLAVTLLTGRTHQIRAHMAYLGYPVLGDDLYGDRAFNRACGGGPLMLRSMSLRIQTAGALPALDGKTLCVPDKLNQILLNIRQKY